MLKGHDNISWHGLSAAEAAMDLEIQIDNLEMGRIINKKLIVGFFEEDGLIDVCASENGFRNEYLELKSDLKALL